MPDELVDSYDDDANGSSPSERDWKGLGTAFVVILIICSCIGVVMILFTPMSISIPSQDDVDWEEIKKVQPPIDHSWWKSPTVVLFVVKGSGISQLDISTGNISKFSESLFSPQELFDYSVEDLYTNDGQYVAKLMSNVDMRRDPDNVTYEVEMHNKEGKHKISVGSTKKSGHKISVFSWGNCNHSYLFVESGHIYYSPDVLIRPIRITDGEGGTVHGTFDWVYEEEILLTTQAVWFSPSDDFIAFASRSEHSSREVISITYTQDAYEKIAPFEYPKTGVKHLPSYSLSIWSISDRKSVQLDVQLTESTSFHYLFGVSWVVLHGRSLLLSIWANRWQNETSMTLCDYHKATCSLLYEHKYHKGQWAQPEDYGILKVVHSSSAIFVILPHLMKSNSWQHIAMIEVTPDLRMRSLSFIQMGEYDVKSIVGFIESSNAILFLTRSPLPWNQHLFIVPYNSSIPPNCISCILTNCTFIDKPLLAPPSKNTSVTSVVYNCKGPDSPFSAVLLLSSLDVQTIQSVHPKSRKKLIFPKFVIHRLNLSSGYEAIVKVFPGDGRVHSTPVILNVYGGPTMNKVTDEMQKNPIPSGYKYAIVYIDVRGSGGRGWKYRSPIYGRLGTVEVEDTLEAMRIIMSMYSRFDPERVAVFGWSYGGFMSLRLVQLAPPHFFKCSISVAPVTNFLLYDATYTERYMGDAPPSAYSVHDISRDVSNFRTTRLLLIHGLRDDNVHFHNSALLMQALQKDNIEFETMVYPNQDHSISNRATHLIGTFDRFLSKCFHSDKT